MPTQRYASLFLAGLLSFGCGGGDSTAPSPFPDAAGVFAVNGYFDGIPSGDAFFSGTLTFTQASRDAGALVGTASYLVTIQGDVFNISDDQIAGANVSPAGVVTYTLAGSSDSWTFTATLSGASLTAGRHTLSTSSGTNSGAWSGSRATGSSMRTAASVTTHNRLSDLAGALRAATRN
jgi:hypothetical protein